MSILQRFEGVRVRHRKLKSAGAARCRRRLFLEALEDRRLLACDAVPEVAISGLSSPFIGEPTDFTLTFDNTGADPGFGPYIDLILPATGTDGDDGLDYFVATHLGVQLTAESLTFDALGQAIHPYAVDSSGNPILVTHPLDALGAGDQLVVLQLPFGSFTDTQTPAEVNITADLSNLADLGEPLTIYASGGFQYGCDALDNPATDPSILGSQTSGSINPRVFEADKVYNGPEGDETATGPNYVQSYDLVVDIADGQPIFNLVIEDLLPPNHVYVGVPSVTINGNPAVLGTDYALTDEPPTVSASPWTAPSSQNNLEVTFLTTVTGTTSGTDVVVTVEFYIAESREGSPPPVVIDPSTGDEVLEDNAVNAEGNWVPLDPRDPPSTVSDSATYEDLEERSIAIQKSVSVYEDNGEPGVSPDDILVWTLNFQVSDFFAFDNLFLTDVLSDGQEFFEDDDPSKGPFFAAPSATITEAGVSTGNLAFTLSATPASPIVPFFSGAVNYYVYPPSATEGTTEIQFDLSKLLRDNGVDDQLVGGLFANRSNNLGPTTGQIVFYTRVLDQYREDFPSGDPSLNENDVLDNDIDIDGDILAANLTDIIGQEDDQGAAGTAVPQGEFVKQVYAVNGITTLPVPLVLVPGDEVTFRVRYDLFLGDFELFRVSDFLPLPIFRAADPNADNYPIYNDTATYTTTDPLTGLPPPGVPLTGQWQRGPADTHTEFADFDGNGTPGDVNVTVDFASNSVTWELGTYDDPDNKGGIIDLLFTVTATGDPFADGLFLTNQATKGQQNTFLEPVEATDIRQVQIAEPELRIQKGVIATDNPAGAFSPATVGPVTFTDPTTPPTSNPRWNAPEIGGTQVINSTALTAYRINSNLTGIDAGDLVTFAIVVENTGRSRRGAFDVSLRDTLPLGFAVPVAGLNLSVTDGTGAAIIYTDLGGTDPLVPNFFENGIQLDDPGPTPPTGSGTTLDTDAGAIDQYDATDGRNIAVITYDLIAVSPPDANAVQPRQTLTNTATLFNYASREGGPDFTEDDLTDDARVRTRDPAMDKSLVETSVDTLNNDLLTEVTIGETIQYQVVITLPEGVTNSAQVVDTLNLGLAFVRLDSIVPSSGDVTSSIDAFDNTASFDPTVTGDGIGAAQVLEFDLGTLTNANTVNTVPETLRLTYTVVVLNTADNQSGGVRDNVARFDWVVDGAPESTPDDRADPVTILEPVLQADKTAVVDGSGTVGQAGSTVVYAIVISHAGTSNTDAYDVTFWDPLPTVLLTPSFTATRSTPGDLNGVFEITLGNVLQTIPGSSFDLLEGQTVTVTVTGTLATSVEPNRTIGNTATIRWTSLDGPDPNERTGTGDVNDYFAGDGADITTRNLALTKSIAATSEPHTADPNLAIGEIVRYRLVTEIPQGTIPDLRLTDLLPAGLLFLNDNTAKVALVSNNPALIISTALTDPAPGTPPDLNLAGDQTTLATIVPEFVVPAGLISGGPPFGSGTDPIFSLGTLTNSEVDINNSEYVVLEFNALVQNTGTNNSGSNRNNQFRAQVGTDPPLTSNTVTATLREPAITDVDKVLLAPAPVDAGDPAYFQVTFSNTGTTTAFDVRVLDVMPPKLSLVVGSIAVSGAAIGSNASTPGQLELTLVSVPAGGSVTVSFTAALTIDIGPGETFVNTVDVTYTSLPGTGTPLGPGNPTGSTTPGGSGAANGERDGSGGPVNDYADSDSVTVTTPGVIKTKQLVATSEAHTSGSSLAVGEIARFRLTAPFPEGTVVNLQFADQLPAGLQFLNDGTTRLAFVSTTVNGMSSSVPGIGTAPWVAGDETTVAGITPAFVLPPAQIGGGPFGSGTDPVFSLGTVINADNDPDREFVVLEFNVLVLNTLDTNDGDVKTDTAAALVDEVPFGTSNPVDVTVREPLIENVDKQIVAPFPTEAGQPVYFEVTFTNTGSATAFDVQIVDVMPVGIAYDNNLVVTGATAADASNVAQLDVTLASVPAGGSVTLTYQGLTTLELLPNQTVINVVGVTYTSLPGTGTPGTGTPGNPTGSTTPGGSGETTGERDGSGGINDYRDGDNDQFSTPPLTFNKTILATSEPHTLGGDVAIGEIIRYRLILPIPAGTVPAVEFRDALPAGLQLLDDGTVLVGFVSDLPGSISSDDVNLGSSPWVAGDETTLPGVTLTFPLPAANLLGGPFGDGTDPTFDLGTLVNGEADANEEYVVVEFNALVLNASLLSTNDDGDPLDNTGTLYSNGSLAATSDTITATVREPQIADVTKTAVPTASLEAGDTVTYTVTFSNTGSTDAFDVVLRDVLNPTFFLLDLGSVNVIPDPGATGVGNTSTGNTLEVTIGRLEPDASVTVTYIATLTTAVTPLLELDNIASVTYSSLPGEGTPVGIDNPTGSPTPGVSGADQGERNGTSGGVNDYQDDDDAVVPTGTIAASKLLRATSESHTAGPQVAIGEIVRYRLVAAVLQGTVLDLRLTDQLPDGLQFLDDGTARVALVADAPANITSSTLAGAGLQIAGNETTLAGLTPTFVLPDSAITPATFLPGTDPTFWLGDIVNSEVDGNLEYVLVEFNALVLNVAANQNTISLTNSFAALTGTSPLATSDTVVVEIVEPEISDVTKTAIAFVGDLVTYQVTFSNTGAATAFDVQLTDALPGGLVLNLASIAVTLAGGAAGADASGSSGNTVWVLVSTIPVGGSVTVTYNASAADNGQSTENTARVAYTSLPGPNGTLTNPTGSTTPGGSGTDIGERDGSDGPGGAVDDYADSDSASVASVSGQKRDADSGAGLAGVTIYLDLNANAAFDVGEPYDVTDAGGNYVIAYLSGGVHTLRELVPDYHLPTSPANGSQTVDFTSNNAVTGADFVNQRVPPQIIDDGDSGFTATGGWEVSGCWLYYQSDVHYLCSPTGGDGSNYLQWEFQGLTLGATYQVSTTWYAGSTRSTDAPFTIYGGASTVTVDVNQQIPPASYPGSFTTQTATWMNLDPAYTILGTTLTVRLTDAHSGGCVVGDAVRIQRVTTPEITVLDGAWPLASGSDTVNLGSTNLNEPLLRTFTVRNDGGADLHLGTITLPPGYSLASAVPPTGTTLSPHEQTAFTVRLDAAALGFYFGTVTLGNDDNDAAPFRFNLEGEVVTSGGMPTDPPATPPPSPLPPPVVGTPISVSQDATRLYDTLSTVAYGTVATGATDASTVRSFTVLNPSSASAHLLLGSIVPPTGYTVVAGYTDTDLAPGESTTFALQLDTADEGTLAGNVNLYDAASERIFTFAVTGTVQAGPMLPAPLILDNGDTGYASSGFSNYSNLGYLKDIQYANAGTGTRWATWTFSSLPSGTYRVSVTWVRGTNRASNASYTLTGVDGSPTLATINQQQVPDDRQDQGVGWEDVRTTGGDTAFSITGGTLTVRLANNANGYVWADAVRIEQLSGGTPTPPPAPPPAPPTPPPLAAPVIVDNGDADYASSGFYSYSNLGYLKDIQYASAGTATRWATWTFSSLPSGTYRVSVTWVRGTNRATNAPYTLTGVDGSPTLAAVNQQLAPDDRLDRGVWWEDLQTTSGGTTFQVTGGTLTVQLTNQANGYVWADAVRVEQLSALESSLIAASDGGSTTGASLASETLAGVTREAVRLWASADADAALRLAKVQVRVEDLPAGILGLAAVHSDTIWVDINADGRGWSRAGDRWSVIGDRSSVIGHPSSVIPHPSSFDLLTVLAHELGHLLGHGHAGDAADVMAATLPPGVRRLPLPEGDGHGDLFRRGWSSSRSAAEGVGDLTRALALSRWDAPSNQDVGEEIGAFAGHAGARRSRADEACDEASDAALLAWADEGRQDDQTQVLAGLRRDGEDEHWERVDSLFGASDDGSWAALGRQTEDGLAGGGR